jgi:hypothetical protein
MLAPDRGAAPRFADEPLVGGVVEAEAEADGDDFFAVFGRRKTQDRTDVDGDTRQDEGLVVANLKREGKQSRIGVNNFANMITNFL